ncbi:alpha-galactosidase [Sistotremastrum niveocremeum HHB9708]|uniref:Alpha-galactosidase n=1 Tax=Sistotremastrum niveocremeum HHB9708 TaxID=1314777 RepID=A0A164PEJ5_9AGAM|nr:alpha-galactosidase [Sistotremastrum niveocremeum HHB9708]
MKHGYLLSVCTFAIIHLGSASENGLARTPQMGWNTWAKFGCGISEETVLSMAKAIVETGLDKFGYQYVVIDDCWHAPSRNQSTGAPLADPTLFPNGIKKLAGDIHGLGLQLGLYSSAGSMTCARRFGSLGYEEIDAETYVSWDIDYLKYDNCYNEGQSGTPLISYNRYKKMFKALNATGRPILYSMCNWGEDQPWNWASTIANSWRISGDLTDNFGRYDDRCPCTSMLDCKLPGFYCSVARIIDFAAPLGSKAGTGGWNDLDILEVITHFSMWSILKSPLLLGNDLTSMSQDTWDIITNDAIIALNQDPVNSAANRVFNRSIEGGGSLSLWVGNLVNGTTVVAIINTSSKHQRLHLSFDEIFIDWLPARTFSYRVFDLWQKTIKAGETLDFSQWTNSTIWGVDLGIRTASLSGIDVGVHATRLFKFVPW